MYCDFMIFFRSAVCGSSGSMAAPPLFFCRTVQTLFQVDGAH
jgi:hypothetical protein